MLDKKIYIVNSNRFTNILKDGKRETRCLASSPLSIEIFTRGEIDCESDCVIVQTSIRGKK